MVVAAYGLVNANAKWKPKSDMLLKSFKYDHISAISRVFMKKNTNDSLILLAMKNVNDILITAITSVLD